MNATNYYVSTTRLVLQADPDSPSSWQDLYTALPTLRNSLSCTVCENLLSEPYTPEETTCEHHVCKSCKGGIKKLRPTCSWCRDYSKYAENVQLRILIQNYKKLCGLIKINRMFGHILRNGEQGQLIRDIIRESEGEKIPQPLFVENVRHAEVETVKEEIKQEFEEDILLNDPLLEEMEPVDEIISSPYSKLKLRPMPSMVFPNIAKVDLGSRLCETQPTPKASPTSSPPSTSPTSLPFNCVTSSTRNTSQPQYSFDAQTPGLTICQSSNVASNHHQALALATSQTVTSLTNLTPTLQPSQTYSLTTSQTTSLPKNQTSSVATSQLTTTNTSRCSPLITSPAHTAAANPGTLHSAVPVSRGIQAVQLPTNRSTGGGIRKIKSEAFILNPLKGKADLPHIRKLDTTPKTSRPGGQSAPTLTKQSLISDYGTISPKVAKIERTRKSSEGSDEANSNSPSSLLKRKTGCRCGNATLCPGKLTCCGQRCPCYVDSLACTDCKCKGCRNPHRPGGGKVRPPLPFMQNMQVVYPGTKDQQATVRVPVTLASEPFSLKGLDLSQLPILRLDNESSTCQNATSSITYSTGSRLQTVNVISLVDTSCGENRVTSTTTSTTSTL